MYACLVRPAPVPLPRRLASPRRRGRANHLDIRVSSAQRAESRVP
jgi:hypothetical protein